MLIDGFRVIVMGDFNLDVRDDKNKLILELKRRGIRERITGRYGPNSAPNTHERGSYLIDGIFASDEIEMIRGGYRGGNPALSDHRFSWAEFTHERGSYPIDGIFASDEIEMIRGGYRGGNPALSDHRFSYTP